MDVNNGCSVSDSMYLKVRANQNMKTFYQISSQETGIVVLKKRKIAKALRWWLRENGFTFKCVYLVK